MFNFWYYHYFFAKKKTNNVVWWSEQRWLSLYKHGSSSSIAQGAIQIGTFTTLLLTTKYYKCLLGPYAVICRSHAFSHDIM